MKYIPLSHEIQLYINVYSHHAHIHQIKMSQWINNEIHSSRSWNIYVGESEIYIGGGIGVIMVTMGLLGFILGKRYNHVFLFDLVQ
jgi:hypothetical protein